MTTPDSLQVRVDQITPEGLLTTIITGSRQGEQITVATEERLMNTTDRAYQVGDQLIVEPDFQPAEVIGTANPTEPTYYVNDYRRINEIFVLFVIFLFKYCYESKQEQTRQ